LLVRLHPWKEQKKFEDAIRYVVKQAVDEARLEGYVADRVEGRHAFTEEIVAQGLRKDIRELAHCELDAMDARTRATAELGRPPRSASRPPRRIVIHASSGDTNICR